MTLDVAKFISNSIRTQAKIQHLDVQTKTTTLKSIPQSVSSIISDEYGKKYLLDADYVTFFWGAITMESIEKLFNVVDKALGKSANKLTDKDFKKINIVEDEVEVDVKDAEVEVEDNGNEEQVEVEDDEVEDSEESSDEELDEDEAVESPAKTSYFFLKITLK